MTKSNLILSLALVLVLTQLIIIRCNKQIVEEENDLLRTEKDTLVKKKNKDGSETATIALFEARDAKRLLEIQSKDETIKWLQNEVKKNKNKLGDQGSVTTISTSTNYSAMVSNDSISYRVKDTCNPIYYASRKDSIWIQYSIIAKKDSTSLNLKVGNAYAVVIGSERIGLFKRKSIVEVTNYNPYTTTKTLRAFQVKERKKHWNISLQGGYGLGMQGLTPYIGIGIGRTLIEF